MDLREMSHGTVLLGGSPLRLLRLSHRGAAVVAALRAGAPVAAAGPGAGLLARRLVEAGMADAVAPPGSGPAPDQVSVVVPVRDRAAGLRALLAAVGPCAQVIVVDDGSTDGSGRVAAACGARVVRHAVPHGPAAARLAAARAAGTPYVAFLDSDVLPEPGWLARTLPWFADPAVAAVAPRVVSAPGRRLRERYEQVRSPLDLGPRGGPVRPGSRLAYVPAAALVVRRELVDFDPGLRYGEDVDLVWRLVEDGWAVRYEPGAVVVHRPRGTWRGWLAQRVGYGSSAAPLARRHPGQLRPLAGGGLGASAWLALAGRHPYAAGGLLGVVTARLARRLVGVPGAPLVAARLVLRGQERVAHQLADALTRVWLPLALLAGRRARLAVAVAVLVPAARDRLRVRPAMPFPVYAALRLADDAAYCAGVWWGCLRERTPLPVLPALPAGRAARTSIRSIP